MEMHYGRHAAALRLHYEPEHRGSLSDATEHAMSAATRRNMHAVYCVVRDHQADLERLLLDKGFEVAHTQVRLVLYTSVLSSVTEMVASPALERVPAAWRTGMTGLTQAGNEESGRHTDWYNW